MVLKKKINLIIAVPAAIEENKEGYKITFPNFINKKYLYKVSVSN